MAVSRGHILSPTEYEWFRRLVSALRGEAEPRPRKAHPAPDLYLARVPTGGLAPATWDLQGTGPDRVPVAKAYLYRIEGPYTGLVTGTGGGWHIVPLDPPRLVPVYNPWPVPIHQRYVPVARTKFGRWIPIWPGGTVRFGTTDTDLTPYDSLQNVLGEGRVQLLDISQAPFLGGSSTVDVYNPYGLTVPSGIRVTVALVDGVWLLLTAQC